MVTRSAKKDITIKSNNGLDKEMQEPETVFTKYIIDQKQVLKNVAMPPLVNITKQKA